MNRRRAIFAVLCGLAGRFSFSQEIREGQLIMTPDAPQSVSIDLKRVTKFVFEHGDQKVELSAEDIWKELQP